MEKSIWKINEKTDHKFAYIYAKAKHKGQFRKKSGEPYIVHPKGVFNILKAFGASEDVLTAALLHDTVEDCGVSINELEELFGKRVAELVSEVTTDSKEKETLGKELALDREMYNVSDDAVTLKLADQLYNYSDRADLKQKRRIQHHVEFLKNNRKLNKIQREIIERLESMFEYM